jgi:hypothetical protein
MNIFKFIESFTNDDLMQSQGSRRDSFGQFGKLGRNLALASIPFGLSTLQKSFCSGYKSNAKYSYWCTTIGTYFRISRKGILSNGIDSGVI